MLSNLLKPKKVPQVRDRVIVFDTDSQTCEILPVLDTSEETIRTASKVFPRADLQLKLGREGRVWVMNAPTVIVEATEHLARVERNMIIRQIAQYRRPFEETQKDWTKIVLFAAVFILGVISALK